MSEDREVKSGKSGQQANEEPETTEKNVEAHVKSGRQADETTTETDVDAHVKSGRQH